MKETDKYFFFWGNHPFSNFDDNDCKGYGIYVPELKQSVPTSEHVYMCYKAIYFEDHNTLFHIANASHPKRAKKYGREVEGYNDKMWNKVKFYYMCQALQLKFDSCNSEKFVNELSRTKGKILVEASPTDKIWGVGLGEDNPDIKDESKWKGENLLGLVLMKIRMNNLSKL